MRLVLRIALILALPFSAFAQDCPELEALRALYGVRGMLMEPLANEYTIGAWIDEQMNELRDPLPDGGYRWVRFIRPTGDGPVIKREHLVTSDQGREQFDEFEASADHPFAVRVVVPRKRSVLRNNKPVYIGLVRIRYTRDGTEKVMEKRVHEWLAPDTSRSYDLGVIADQAEVAAQAATRSADVKNALVEIHFRQALAQDDPENPNYETIAALKRVRSSLDAVTLDLEIARLERRLFPDLDVIPFTTISVLLREAEVLIRSDKPEDLTKGQKILAQVVRSLPR